MKNSPKILESFFISVLCFYETDYGTIKSQKTTCISELVLKCRPGQGTKSLAGVERGQRPPEGRRMQNGR